MKKVYAVISGVDQEGYSVDSIYASKDDADIRAAVISLEEDICIKKDNGYIAEDGWRYIVVVEFEVK